VVASWLDYKPKQVGLPGPGLLLPAPMRMAVPVQARYGFGDPAISFSNEQYGLFVQDDWRITPNFTAHVGLRLGRRDQHAQQRLGHPGRCGAAGSRTPAAPTTRRSAARPTGALKSSSIRPTTSRPATNRSSYSDMYQPRLGFTWDVGGNAKTVVYGGWASTTTG